MALKMFRINHRLSVGLFLVISIITSGATYAERNQSANAEVENTQARESLADIYRLGPLGKATQLSLAVIDHELQTISNRKYRVSKKQRNQIKKALLAKFHPQELLTHLANKIEPSDLVGKYRTWLSSSEAQKLIKLQNHHLNHAYQEKLFSYQKKLTTSMQNNERYKLVEVYDGLYKESKTQAALIHAIQASVYESLPKKSQKLYVLPSEAEISSEIAKLNIIVNLYSFRHIPTEDIVDYLDALVVHRDALSLIDTAYRETLAERTALVIQLDP